MASVEEILALVERLGPADRALLARRLAPPPLFQRVEGPAPHSAAWVRAEEGHAVLATGAGPADEEIPRGAAAIRGMWMELREARS